MDPDEQALIGLLAQLWLRHGVPEKARTLLRGATKLAPGEPELLKLLAWAEVACGDGEAALAAIERYRAAVEKQGPGTDELDRGALIGEGVGRPEEARASFGRFIRRRVEIG